MTIYIKILPIVTCNLPSEMSALCEKFRSYFLGEHTDSCLGLTNMCTLDLKCNLWEVTEKKNWIYLHIRCVSSWSSLVLISTDVKGSSRLQISFHRVKAGYKIYCKSHEASAVQISIEPLLVETRIRYIQGWH